MKSCAINFVAVMLSALFVVACAALTPTHRPSPSRLPATNPPRATLVASATVVPTPQAITQDAIFAAVGRWIATNKRAQLTPVIYVLEDISNPERWFYPEEVPELRGAGAPAWGNALTDASHSAIEAALAPLTELEFVADSESAVDPDGFEHFGCRPYIGGRMMIKLGAPIHVRDRFFVEANLDRGCQGDVYLLQLELTSSDFEVTRIVRDGFWIV